MTLDELCELMESREHEHLEFKEAKQNIDFDSLADYCVALANECGGQLILGITPKHPRSILGSQAVANVQQTKHGIYERLHLRVELEELRTPDGHRVVVVRVPSRPLGTPLHHKGRYLMRAGGSLVAMTADMLQRILEETKPDFSAETCTQATLSDLAPEGIARSRKLWTQKSGNSALQRLSDEQLLSDAELLVDSQITYAALALLGTERATGRHLGQAEVIWEYRSRDAAIPHDARESYRRGFFLFYEDLMERIGAHNDLQHYQDGLFMWDIPTFNDRVVREALLNAVTHRDYRLQDSVIVRHSPRIMNVISPGGFPPGVSAENILDKCVPRNRRIAATFEKCGFVERGGQGADLMFTACIRESKPRPDYSRSDEFQVWLTLRGEIQNPQFLSFLERIGQEQLQSFSTEDFLLLDAVHREEPVPEKLRPRLGRLLEQGIIEREGRGRGTRYLLSRRFYTFVGQPGTYTRRRGLDRETNKQLLLRHIRDNKERGYRLRELRQVLPHLSSGQVQVLLRELRDKGLVHGVGRTSAGRWYSDQAK